VKSLLLAGAAVQRVLEGRDWQFCFIGGVANFRWGTPRLTNDLDLTLLAGFGNETAYAEALLTEFEGRIPDALEFALRHRVVLLRTDDGFAIDVALGAMLFEAATIQRSSKSEIVPGAGVAHLLGGRSDRTQGIRSTPTGLGRCGGRDLAAARRPACRNRVV